MKNNLKKLKILIIQALIYSLVSCLTFTIFFWIFLIHLLVFFFFPIFVYNVDIHNTKWYLLLIPNEIFAGCLVRIYCKVRIPEVIDLLEKKKKS